MSEKNIFIYIKFPLLLMRLFPTMEINLMHSKLFIVWTAHRWKLNFSINEIEFIIFMKY